MFFLLLSLSFFLDCIDIICAFSTLALVFKETKKKKEKKGIVHYEAADFKQGEPVFSGG